MIKVHGFLRSNLIASGISFLNNDSLHDEECFQKMLNMEQKRAEQLNKSFMLILIDVSALLKCKKASKIVQNLVNAIYSITRETDIKGWYDPNRIIGIIYTEFDDNSIDMILNKLNASVRGILTPDHCSLVHVSYIISPQDRKANNLIVGLNAA